MKRSQNTWPVLESSLQVRRWHVPGTQLVLPLVHGAGGFMLTHLALWFHEEIEPLDRGQLDDWGYAFRQIRGDGVQSWSNHASGTAVDLNATRHPLGVPTHDTFTDKQIRDIRRRLILRYGSLIRWGGSYTVRPDAMHFELDAPRQLIRAKVLTMKDSPRARRVREANPVITKGKRT